MRALFDGIPLDRDEHLDDDQRDGRCGCSRSTVASPRSSGVDAHAQLHGHHPERHHQGVPLARHLRLPARALAAADRRHGRLHGRTRSRSGTRSTSAATTCRRPARRRCRSSPTRSPPRSRVLDAVQDSRPGRRRSDFAKVVGRISFFVNAGVRFVEEMCKMRAFVELWDEIDPRALRRHRPEAAPVPLRRAGQLARPDRGAAREQRPAHRARDARRDASKDARARAVQLPAWNEALGLPRPWDQQWSLRMQQVLAYETDLLEYDDLFDGSHGRRGQGRRARRRRPGRDGRASQEHGRRGRRGRVGLHEAARWSPSHAERRAPDRGRRRRSSSASTSSTETEPSPLTADLRRRDP